LGTVAPHRSPEESCAHLYANLADELRSQKQMLARKKQLWHLSCFEVTRQASQIIRAPISARSATTALHTSRRLLRS